MWYFSILFLILFSIYIQYNYSYLFQLKEFVDFELRIGKTEDEGSPAGILDIRDFNLSTN